MTGYSAAAAADYDDRPYSSSEMDTSVQGNDDDDDDDDDVSEEDDDDNYCDDDGQRPEFEVSARGDSIAATKKSHSTSSVGVVTSMEVFEQTV